MTLCRMPLRGKRVFISDWQKLPPDSPLWVKLAWPGCNWGLRLDELLVVDCDSQDAVDRWTRWCAEAGVEPSPYQLQGRPDRRSFWYRRPDPCPIQTGDLRTDIEIKSGPGHQCVIPPSIHPDTNEPYKWVGRAALAEDATVVPEDMPYPPVELLVAKQRYRATAIEEGPGLDVIPSGERNIKLTAFAGSLWSQGYSEEVVARETMRWNLKLTAEPLDYAEVGKLVRSILKRPRRGWRQAEDLEILDDEGL